MNWLVIVGVVLSLIGLGGLILSMIRAARIKRDGGEGPEVQAKFQKLIALNMGSLFLSVIGLMCVVFAVILM